jgi:hypothetical protein
VPNIRPLYLATDDQPTLIDAVLAGLATQSGLAMIERISSADSGKKIANQALKQSGYALRYGDWRVGYGCKTE